MKKLEMIKTGVSWVVAGGIGTIVGNAIKSTTPDEKAGALKKLSIFVGGMVLTSMITDKAVKHVEAKIDSAVAGAKKIVEEEEKPVEKTV